MSIKDILTEYWKNHISIDEAEKLIKEHHIDNKPGTYQGVIGKLDDDYSGIMNRHFNNSDERRDDYEGSIKHFRD